ncbi:hypothetical protein [uncultured Clostridium sp.]|uniref:hypothetical protein n=1 Tax=uncultured Clostridium sp. TaxID=59620 RepID=UPI0028F110EB|nr:hypothetical protein [uncultured Clostridium sp.]
MEEIINYSLFDLIDSQDKEKSVSNNKDAEEIKEEIIEGNAVIVSYGSIEYTGKVTRIYNNGETINVSFNGKHAAFHKSKVKRA